MAEKPNILIATPTISGLITAETTTSIAGVMTDLAGAGIRARYMSIEGNDVAYQRDEIAGEALHGPYTHLFMIDADMGFAHDLCRQMLRLSRGIIGAISTHKYLDLALVKSKVEAGASFDSAVAGSYEFNISSGPITPDGPLLRVNGVGAALMLISRGCLEQVSKLPDIKTYPSRIRAGQTLRGFFRRIEMPDGSLLPEDWSFCHRVRQSGQSVYALAAPVRHLGLNRHSAAFRDHLDARAMQASKQSKQA